MAKPASGTPLDTGGPLYSGLAAVWAFLEGSGGTSADSFASRTLTLNGTSWQTDADGPVWRFADVLQSSPALIEVSSALTVGGNSGGVGVPFSIAFGAVRASNVADRWAVTDNSRWIGLNAFADGFIMRDDNTSDFNYICSGASQLSKANYVIVSVPSENGGAGFMHVYQNATELVDSPLNEGNTKPPFTISSFGTRAANTAQNFVGDLAYFYVWDNRALTPTEVTSLHANPYQIFQSALAGSLLVKN